MGDQPSPKFQFFLKNTCAAYTRGAHHWTKVLAFSLLLSGSAARAQAPLPERLDPAAETWVNQTLLSLSLEEKIGQLFMVQAASRADQYNAAELEAAVLKLKVGGVIWFQGGPQRQAQLTNRYQQMATVPLLIGQDAEWSLAMRLDSTYSYPRAMALGALDDDSLLIAFGRQLARECRAVGVHTPFAPVVDVNNNALNPVIAQRAFSSDKHRVTRCALRVMHGLQSAGALAVAKHFPGHGDTDTDSHYDLPVIRHPRTRLDSLELYPFRTLIQNGVAGVMVAHLHVPALDTARTATLGRPSTLSTPIVTGLLRRELGFNGLVFTDALMMKGVTRQVQPGQVELEALLAGADVLLMPENLPVAIDRIRRAIYAGELSLVELDARVRRILTAKARLGLHRQRLVDLRQVRAVLDSPEAQALYRTLNRRAVVLAADPQRRLPLGQGDSLRVAYIQVGGNGAEPFGQVLTALTPTGHARLAKDAPSARVQQLIDSIAALWPRPSAVVLGLYQTSRIGQPRYGITPTVDDLICGLERHNLPLVCVTMGVPYAMQHLPPRASHIIAWSDDAEAQRAAAALVLGHAPDGRRPITRLPTVVPGFSAEARRWLAPGPRLHYAPTKTLSRTAELRLDSLSEALIADAATPGTVVLALRGEQIIYAKGWGHTDFDLASPTADPATTIYDLASVTKVLSTTLAAMKLVEEGRLDLTAPLEAYIPRLADTKLGRRQVLNLLQHDAGLIPFQHFVERFSLDHQPHPHWFRTEASDSFNLAVAEGLWLRRDAPDTVLRAILGLTPALPAGQRVVYSDLGFILLGHIVERIVGERLEFYVQREFYRPLGMHRTHFMPALKCLPEHWAIAPTELDTVFRRRRIQGTVHDEAAALLGGYAGHAGLFSTGTDVARLLLMLKSGGVYAGRRYLSPETIASFTAARGAMADGSINRRGLGWDKPPADPTAPSPTSRFMSPEAYGHQGFTGTCVWVDPRHDLAIVVLANRTWPSRHNGEFNSASYRTRVVDILYEGLGLVPTTAAGTE